MQTLAITMFYREHCNVPNIKRKAGAKVAKRLFNSQRDFIFESNKKHAFQRTSIEGDYLRGGAQRSPLFFR